MIPTNLNLVKYNQIVEQFHKIESDRAAAILVACIVEQSLKEFIQLYIVEEPEKTANLLLNNNMSVNTFSSQIKYAYKCGWITNKIKRDLDTIRCIRNQFSHDPDINGFSQIPDEPRFQDYSRNYDPDNLRSQYLLTAGMTVGEMWNIILPFLRKRNYEVNSTITNTTHPRQTPGYSDNHRTC
jgi:hypothetical protein